MFEFKRKDVLVAHINIRDEKHGEESVLAVDLKIKADMPNTMFDTLAPGLLTAIYAATEEQEEMFEGAPRTRLRFGPMGPITWSTGVAEGKITFHRVTREVSLVGVVKQIKMVPKDGGTVECVFTVQSTPDPDVVGQLSAMLGIDQEATFELIKPEQQKPGDEQ
jgi:hypothetical protein